MIRSDETAGVAQRQEKIFSQELVRAIVDHFRLLLLGPPIIALLAYLVATAIPEKYLSTAYLRIDRGTSRSIEALLTSPGIADKVLARFTDIGTTTESRIQFLVNNLWITDVEPQGDRQTVRLFRFEIGHTDPRTAQAINVLLLDEWLKTTIPGPVERANLEAELSRSRVAAAANSALIEQLQKEATNLVLPSSLPGEIATPISALITKRDLILASILANENRLSGAPRDVIAAPPHLPAYPNWPKKNAIAILSAAVAIPTLLAAIILGRSLAPGLPAGEALIRVFRKKKR